MKCEIEVLDSQGDNVQALENSLNNLTDRTFTIYARGRLPRPRRQEQLASLTWGGANADQGGGGATTTFSYSNFDSLAVYHPQDPSGM